MRSGHRRHRRTPPPLVTALVAIAALAGCSSDGGDGADEAGGEVLVFAAASLTDAFDDLARAFEADRPGTDVELTTAGSSSLREQILDGAPVDVFAPADPSHLEALQAAGAVDGPAEVFARNRLVLAVPAGNPAGVGGLADLGRDELLVGLCAEGVPCGDLARRALASAGIVAAPDTDEPDVRSLLAKVEAGELDVGVVYHTDVVASGGGVDGIEVGGADLDGTVATYRVVVLADAPEPDLAEAFVAFVLGPDGRAILAEHGFEQP